MSDDFFPASDLPSSPNAALAVPEGLEKYLELVGEGGVTEPTDDTAKVERPKLSKADEAQIRAALKVTPADDYKVWLDNGMALKSAMGEKGLSLWDTWSRTSSRYEPGKCLEKWRSFRDDGEITLGTLFHHAEVLGKFEPTGPSEDPTEVFSKEPLPPEWLPQAGGPPPAPALNWKGTDDMPLRGTGNHWKKLGLHIVQGGTDKKPVFKPAEGDDNMHRYFQKHPNWEGKLKVNVRTQNAERSGEGEINPIPALRELCRFMDYKRSPTVDTIGRVIVNVARQHEYDPVIEYLEALPAWDGTDRLSTFCQNLGIEDNDTTRSYITRWLISGVARAYKPGCEAQHILVLHGEQGQKKSALFKLLAVDSERWYRESHIDTKSKDGSLALLAPWIIEMGEMSGMDKANQEQLKVFISSPIDRFRPPYERTDRPFPRRCILGATTNLLHFLRDPTGSRRFWTISVTDRLNLGYLTPEVVGQVWAEARSRYLLGERWWDDVEDQKATAAHNEEHYETTLLDYRVAAALDMVTEPWTTMDAVWSSLMAQGPLPHGTRERDIGPMLTRLGWTSERKMVDGVRTVRWHRPAKHLTIVPPLPPTEGQNTTAGGTP